MKADRLMTALLLLQAHGRLSSRALAARLEVSPRTVHRDMEALGASGVPVLALRGARGGWQLDEGWRTRVPGLDDGELRALLMTQPRALGDSRLAASAERALTKLIAALPLPLRDRARSIRERLYVDPTGWHRTADDLSALPTVQDAVALDRVLAFDYRPPGRDQAARIVHPLGLVAKGTTWYLVAGTANGLRTYRVSRMRNACMRDETFDRPAGFDLAAHWVSSVEAFRTQPRYPVMVRVDARGAGLLRAWFRTADVAAQDDDGRATLRVDFSDETDARFIVLGLGSAVEVIEPAGLRDAVAAEIVRMAGNVRGDRAVGRRRSPGHRRH